ncbi:MAG: hypothetical protein ACTSRW_13840, partial [Candidatus Helarchaeota archaeon]
GGKFCEMVRLIDSYSIMVKTSFYDYWMLISNLFNKIIVVYCGFRYTKTIYQLPLVRVSNDSGVSSNQDLLRTKKKV